MKKTVLSALLVLTAMIGANAAHAFEITGLIIAIPLEAGIEVTALVVAPTATTAAAGADDKQAYFSNLRDDAVAQVAEGGAPSAVLADAIRQIRVQTGTIAADRDVALDIVKAMN